MKKMTMGVIVGNRGFFPDHLAKEGRMEMIQALKDAGMNAVCPGPNDTKYGAVETREEAKKCAELFRANQEKIDGVIVTLPNFGDERAVAETLRMANLNIPVLIQATPDTEGKMTVADRRDSFCGKMSIRDNLKQYGIPYSLTGQRTVSPNSDEFKKDLEWFGGVCRVTNGLRKVRIGAIGAWPAATPIELSPPASTLTLASAGTWLLLPNSTFDTQLAKMALQHPWFRRSAWTGISGGDDPDRAAFQAARTSHALQCPHQARPLRV